MNRRLSISLLDPDAKRTDVTGGIWLTSSVNAAGVEQLRSAGADPAVGASAVRASRNAVVLLVTTGEEHPAVYAWRGLLGSADIFFAVTPDGDVVVSDHVRNVAAAVPAHLRTPSDDVLLEHYLCGWVWDRHTFCGGVRRMAPGDALRIDLETGEEHLAVFDRVTPVAEPDGRKDAVDRVEAALEGVAARWRDSEDVALAFSGGVDSTLLASFFDDRHPLVTMTTDSPEFASETEYAAEAASLMGRTIDEVRFLERDYVEILEYAMDQMATPPMHYVVPALSPLYDRDDQTVVFGEGADSIFGTDRGLRRIAGGLSNSFGLWSLAALQNLPGPVGRRSSQVRSYAEHYALPTTDPRGSIGTSLTYGDSTLVESFVGAEAVDRILSSHVEAISARVDFEMGENRRFRRHVEMIGWRNTMSDLTLLDRLLGQPRGKRIVMPYADASVVDAISRVPADQRYMRGLTGKWVLKDILKRRVSGYPVNQRKNATGLPFLRYCVDGPLVDIWGKYQMPDFVPADAQDMVKSEPSHVTWNALTHAVWLERIGKNPHLTPHEANVTLDMGAPAAAQG